MEIEIETYERSGRPDKTIWKMIRKVRPGHEEILLDGIAQSVRNEETLRDRSAQTELELSVDSRSFVNGVNDQVRKKQRRISNVTEDGGKHSKLWWMFMTVTIESAVFMGKNNQNSCRSIKYTEDFTLKRMFDISSNLVSEQDEISGLKQLVGRIIHGNICN